MVEREEMLIKEIIKLQKAHNSLKLDDEIEKYKKDIEETYSIVEKTKSEIRKLTSKLDEMKTKNENNNSDIEQNIKNKKHELDSKLGINSMKKLQLEALEKVNENFNNEEYVLGLIIQVISQMYLKITRQHAQIKM